MAVELFKLVGSIFIDNEKANDSLQKTDKKASSFGETLGKVGKGALQFASIAGGAMLAVGGAALGVANNVAETADTIDKASIRMGISAEQYQELAYAAGQCGVEMSTMEQAAKKLEGTDINFEDAIEQIMSLATEEERSAAAADLFGEKVAYNLSPLLAQSTKEFDGLIQRANDLGIVMSGDAVKAGVQFGDLMSDLKQSAQALGTSLGSALFPILIDIIQQILAFMPQIQGFMAQITPILSQVVAAILPVLFSILEALLPVAMKIVEAVLPLAVELINALLPLITALLPLIDPISELLLAILVPLVDLLSSVLPPLISSITFIINGVMPALIKIIQLVTATMKDNVKIITNFVKPFVQNFIDLFNGLGTFFTGVFTGNWKMAWEGLLNIMKSYVNGIIRGIEAFVNLFVDTINTVINAAKRLANLVPNVDLDTSVSVIPKVTIPKLAKGGVITEEGQAIVGEAGEELLTLPKGAKVEPLSNSPALTKEDITSAFIEALQTVGLQITLNPNAKNLFDEVVAQNTVYKRTHGGLSAL